MTIKRYHPWRRAAGAAEAVAVLGLPFLRIGGESALRFDVPTLRLHFFGRSVWMDEFYLVLMGLFFLTFFFLLITVLFGRLWCGWVCPQAVLSDFTAAVDHAGSKPFLKRSAAYLFTFFLSAVVGASLVWYFVSPYEFIPALLDGSLGPVPFWSWVVLTALAFGNYTFLRQTWCATVCPYAKLQGVLFDDNTLVIAYDEQRDMDCMDCRACVKACPVKVDIRRGLSGACIGCASCVDTCAERMEPQGKKTLIDYCFGSPGRSPRNLRPSTLITGSLTLLFLVLFLFLAFSRNPLDMTVLPSYNTHPMVTGGGAVVNSYLLAMKNRSKSDKELAFRVRGTDEARVMPERAFLKAGEERKIPVSITVAAADRSRPVLPLEISAETTGNGRITVTKRIAFRVPGA